MYENWVWNSLQFIGELKGLSFKALKLKFTCVPTLLNLSKVV